MTGTPSDPAANIAVVVVDGPENNLLNPDVMGAVAAGLKAADQDDAVDAILLTGAGDAFGANALDPSTRPQAARGGYEQGRALADSLAERWHR